ncbi:hypothetical protein F5X99DRAFT_376577 [Biscogniauxia marginata]|nr:hypothetical protein F5X99DRAFT_376577 [Biscogniauxia marginata]
MPPFLNSHAKARARSVQLDSNAIMEKASVTRRDSANIPPVSSTRSSSLPEPENQPPSIRNYRSMLVVDAPTLGPLKPMSYDELYADPAPGICLRTRSCNLLPGIFIMIRGCV